MSHICDICFFPSGISLVFFSHYLAKWPGSLQQWHLFSPLLVLELDFSLLCVFLSLLKTQYPLYCLSPLLCCRTYLYSSCYFYISCCLWKSYISDCFLCNYYSCYCNSGLTFHNYRGCSVSCLSEDNTSSCLYSSFWYYVNLCDSTFLYVCMFIPTVIVHSIVIHTWYLLVMVTTLY